LKLTHAPQNFLIKTLGLTSKPVCLNFVAAVRKPRFRNYQIEKVQGTISSIKDFGAFVDLGGIEGNRCLNPV
jgi:adenylate cyclase class IV